MKIARCRYNVPSLDSLEAFYCGLLGMQRFDAKDSLVLGYDPRQCLLEFCTGDYRPFRTSNNSFYWKIGITVRDLDQVVAGLRARGLWISDPRQFLDVGYLCHLHDPNGFPIELLQQGFQGNHSPVETQTAHPLAAQAILAHITLRTSNLSASQKLYEQRLNMRLMSRQRITLPERKFDLYFYGWSDETLPEPNVESVANREWLYARPHSFVELQHLVEPPTPVVGPISSQSGFAGLCVQDDEGKIHELSAADLMAAE